MERPADKLAFPPDQIAALLRATLDVLKGEARSLGQEQLCWRPRPEAWSLNEIIGHMIEAERRGFADRIRLILEREDALFEVWDQDAVVRERNDRKRNGRELLHEFELLRYESIQLVRSLRPGQLDRSGWHPSVGELRIRDLMHEWVFHDRAHLQQVFDIVKALMWPRMGNSRLFVAPIPDERRNN